MHIVRLMLGVSAIALIPSAAYAQAGPVPAPSTTDPSDQGLQDIIVTASKVSSDVQKIPVAITTVSGADLQRSGITDATQLNKLVPGVRVEQAGGGAVSLFVRGVGSTVLNAFGDPANAFSVDGVFYSRPSGPNATLFDVSRVEVLKGPQGTLYGRNATGGAFNVVTNRPELNHHGMDASIEAGNYAAVRASAAVNLPVGDDLAIRLAGQSNYRHGYFSDGYDDDNTKAARASILWKPTSTVTVFASADYATTGGKGASTVPVGPGPALTTRYVVPNDPRVGPSDPRITAYANAATFANEFPPLGIAPNGLPVCAGAPVTTPARPGTPAIPLCTYPFGTQGNDGSGFVDNHYWGYNLTTDVDFGFGTWTTVGGFRGTKTDTRFFIGPSGQDQQSDVHQWSAETRLASNDRGSPLKWIVGAFYLRETQQFDGQFSSDNLAVPNPVVPATGPLPATTCASPVGIPVPGLCVVNASIIQRSFALHLPNVVDSTEAVFGQATYSILPALRLTGGLRYTHEKKISTDGTSTQNYTTFASAMATGVPVTTVYPSTGSVAFNDLSYRAGLEYDVARRSMAYAQFATAYHAGGINLGVATGPNGYAYKPERVKSYTVGIKNRLFDNRVQLNLEGFWLDYTNLQVNSLGRINDGSVPCSTLNIVAACPLALRTDNAGKARFRGIEGDVEWQAWIGGTLSANVLYNDSRYLQFSIAGLTGAVTDYAGERVSGVSPLTIGGGLNQQFPLGNGAALIFDARTQYKSDTWMYYVQVPGNFQKAYTRTDLSLTYQADHRVWSVTAFVRNVENKDTLLQGYTQNAETGVPWNFLNPPRTYGGSLSVHF